MSVPSIYNAQLVSVLLWALVQHGWLHNNRHTLTESLCILQHETGGTRDHFWRVFSFTTACLKFKGSLLPEHELSESKENNFFFHSPCSRTN